MLADYVGLLVLFGLAVAVGGGLLALSALLGPRRHERATLAPYECGVAAPTDPRRRTAVHYYLIAVLFIVFDIEAAFLWAWAAVFRDAPGPYFAVMAVFMGVLTLGLVYAWAKGALEWE